MIFSQKGRFLKIGFRILLVLGLPILGLGFSPNLKPKLFELRVSQDPSDISCGDVVSLFRWGALHHGLGKPNYKSPSFSKRVAHLFAEKTDPQKLLLLHSDLETLTLQAQLAWEAVLEKNDCSYYQKWSHEKNQLARNRFGGTLKQWLKSHSLLSKPFLKDSKKELLSFAISLEELSLRQEQFLRQIVKESHPSILESYKNRANLFFVEKLNELVLRPDHSPNSLLAKAALAALDPYSTYFSQSEFSDFYEELSGSSSGIGLEVQKTPQGIGITEVLVDSPAAKSGLQVGDEIIAINGNSLKDLSFKASIAFLKGENATQVQLTLSRKDKSTQDIFVERRSDVFREQKVTSQWLSSGEKKRIALISIPSFYGRGGLGEKEEVSSSSSEDFQKELLKLTKTSAPLDALVIDLRGNPGGYLEEAVAIAGFFLGSRPIVGVKDNSELRILKSELNVTPIYTGPLLVAIDEETASAGEVLASALKDYQRAILVGAAASFGKGSVQKLFQLDDPFLDLKVNEKTGVMKLTTSVFFSPLGHSPSNGGVTSHVVLSRATPKKASPSFYKNQKVVEEQPLLDPREIERIRKQEESLNSKIAQIEVETESGSITNNQILKVSDQVVDLVGSTEVN